MNDFNVYSARPGTGAITVVFGSFTLYGPSYTNRRMGLLNWLTSIFTSGRDDHQHHHETFRYRCRKCNAVFQSNHRHVTDESCPRCGAEDVRPDVQFE